MGSGFSCKTKGRSEAEILIYEDVGSGFFGGVTAKDFANELAGLGSVDTIHLHIASLGGDVHEGLGALGRVLARWQLGGRLRRARRREAGQRQPGDAAQAGDEEAAPRGQGGTLGLHQLLEHGGSFRPARGRRRARRSGCAGSCRSGTDGRPARRRSVRRWACGAA